MAQQVSARPTRDAYEVLQVRPDASQIVIRAAFRALAAQYHPDSDESAGSDRRMAELNDAYAQLRTADRRAVYDRLRQPAPAIHSERAQPQHAPAGARRESGKKGVLDFGRYVGWSVADLARHDPDYLRWLSRHSSGIRYRREIAELLDGAAQSRPEATRTKRNPRR
jgi:curved DNA-binding protein CbpA